MKYGLVPGSLAAAITLTMLLLVQPARADERDGAREGGPAVLTNREVREKTGKTIAQWGAKWWQWAFKNPEVLGDTTGEFGYLGDVGGPVFLPRDQAVTRSLSATKFRVASTSCCR